MRWLVACGLLIISSPLAAQSRWVVIDGEGSPTISIDMKTLKMNKKEKPGIYLVWYELTYSPPQEARDNSGNVYYVKRAKMQELVNCNDKKSILIKYIDYKKDGQVIKSNDFSDILALAPLEWKDPIPDSIGEAMVEKACEYFKSNGI